MKNAWKNKSHHAFYKKGIGKFLHKERSKYIKGTLLKISGADTHSIPKLMIDLGCGDGVLTEDLQMNSLKILAIDFDINRILKIKDKTGLNTKLLVSDVTHLALKDSSADIILIHHVIEHVDSPDEEVINNCRDILRQGGYLIIGIPNEDSFLGRLSRRIHPRLYAEGEHIKYYSEKSMTTLVKSKGFSIESIGRVGFLFPIYYIHLALISFKPFFYLGHYLTRLFKTSADSLIIVCRKDK